MGFFDSITDAIGLTNHSGDRALQAQTNAANAANATQQQMYNTTRGDLSPYREAGSQGLGQLQNNLPSLLQSYTGQDLQNDPGYQFRMQQGMDALQNSAAARGNLNSGATLKALNQYGQNFASNEYNNAYNRFNNDRQMKYNMLSGLASLGENAAAQTGNFGANAANQIASNQVGIGNAAASNIVQGQNNFNNFLGNAIGTGAVLASDRRLKKNIEPISHKDLAEFKSTIKPYVFEYIDPEFGNGKYPGVMAQDLEKSKLGRLVVFTDKDGFKKIDLKKLSSLLLASFAEEAA